MRTDSEIALQLLVEARSCPPGQADGVGPRPALRAVAPALRRLGAVAQRDMDSVQESRLSASASGASSIRRVSPPRRGRAIAYLQRARRRVFCSSLLCEVVVARVVLTFMGFVTLDG